MTLHPHTIDEALALSLGASPLPEKAEKMNTRKAKHSKERDNEKSD
jgi:hypothetical protein